MSFPEHDGVAGEVSSEVSREVSAAPSQAALAYLLDLGNPLAYALGGRSVGIGRDPVNYVTLPEITTSRFHAEVRYEPRTNTFTFHSMGAHGSKVNGAPVSDNGVALSEGDVVVIGGTSLRFTAAEPPAPYRVIKRAEQVPTSRSAATPPLQRSVEPPTAGDPVAAGSTAVFRSRRALIAMAALVVVAIVIVLYLHGRHPA
jgi:pSer/pThr/pTyr-binding forkhead associated (FHA) protein